MKLVTNEKSIEVISVIVEFILYIEMMDSNSDSSGDEVLWNIAERNKRVYRNRPDHFIEWDDQEFFNRFRLSKNTVEMVLNRIYDEIKTPTERNHAITPAQKLLIALRYYATGSMLITMGDFSGVHKTSVSRVVKEVSEVLANLRHEYIKFPLNAEKSHCNAQFYQFARVPRVIGAIDCTHIRINSPGGDQAETFRNRKGYFSINVQLICDANCKIMDIVARWPGSTHDQTIFNNSVVKARFDRGEFDNNILIGDAGYAVANYVLVPLREVQTPHENLYQEAIIRTRNVVERTFGIWKRRFPVLAKGISLKLPRVQAVIVACAILQNIAIEEKELNPPDVEDINNLVLEGDIPLNNEEIGNRTLQDQYLNYFHTLLQ